MLTRVATIRYVNDLIVRRDSLTVRLSDFLGEVASAELPLYGVRDRKELLLQLKEISFRTHRPRTRSFLKNEKTKKRKNTNKKIHLPTLCRHYFVRG